MKTTDQVRSQPVQPSGMLAISLNPAVTPIPFADRLKAVGLIALAGTLGVGVVLLGRKLWHPYADEGLLPLPGEAESAGSSPAPLRDRVPVTPAPASIGAPESIAIVSPRRDRPAQPRLPQQSTTIHINHGFESSQPLIVAAKPAPIGIAEAPKPAVAQVPPTTAPSSQATDRPKSPQAVITALLKPPPAATETVVKPPSRNGCNQEQLRVTPVPQSIPASGTPIAPR